MEVPFLDLKRQYRYLKPEIDRRLKTALDHQQWIMGPEVRELEDIIAHYIGTKFAISVASGTDALVISLRALAYQRTGRDFWTKTDEVITTPFTFAATADAILRAGATPVFVDIDPLTFNINPERVEKAVTKNTVGIIPVHLYGQACAMTELREIAHRYNLFILEDVAQAFGAMSQGKKCGAWGDAGAFSFFPSKNLGGFGDGGIVTTNDKTIAEFVDILRRHGGKDKYNVDYLGYNSRLDTMQAAILLARFSALEEFNARRIKIATTYSEVLNKIPGLTVPQPPRHGENVFHQYTICHPERDRLKRHLDRAKVATMVYYPIPLHRMKLFSSRCRIAGDLTEAEKAARAVLSLPIEPLLEPEEVQFVLHQVEACLQPQTVPV